MPYNSSIATTFKEDRIMSKSKKFQGHNFERADEDRSFTTFEPVKRERARDERRRDDQPRWKNQRREQTRREQTER